MFKKKMYYFTSGKILSWTLWKNLLVIFSVVLFCIIIINFMFGGFLALTAKFIALVMLSILIFATSSLLFQSIKLERRIKIQAKDIKSNMVLTIVKKNDRG